VKVRHGEGLANHTDPESCVAYREVGGEALTGERAGQPLSRETVLMLAAAATPLVSGGLKTVMLAAVRRRTARFSDRRHQASGMWSFAL
jgi:hypothetical protein